MQCKDTITIVKRYIQLYYILYTYLHSLKKSRFKRFLLANSKNI